MLSRRAAFVAVLALALLAGPAAAACSACCPSNDERSVVVMSMPACCGNCAPSLECATDQVPAAVKKTTNNNAVAAFAKSALTFAVNPSFPSIAPLACPSYFNTPSPPAPLRL